MLPCPFTGGRSVFCRLSALLTAVALWSGEVAAEDHHAFLVGVREYDKTRSGEPELDGPALQLGPGRMVVGVPLQPNCRSAHGLGPLLLRDELVTIP